MDLNKKYTEKNVKQIQKFGETVEQVCKNLKNANENFIITLLGELQKKGVNNMNKTTLKEKFELAKKYNLGIAIELTVPTREASEIILTRPENLDYKLDYYLNNYNDNLELERCKDVKILSIQTVNMTDL